MRGNNRKSIEKCRKKLPQFTTMNVIDGQAGLVIYSSLIFYSLTIDNILNIIVLLILAGVSIATLTGNNGILTRANEAKEKTEEAEQKEKEDLNSTEDLINQYAGIDWDSVLENATKHPDQVTSTAIGVGTDGKSVNMDLWEYSLEEDGNYNIKYKNENMSLDGKIIGTVPEYIIEVKDGKRVCKSVTSMHDTFLNNGELEEAPVIPNTVKNLISTFEGCSNLKEAPVIPNSVENMQGTFAGTKLKETPNIPDSVTRFVYVFYNCSELQKINKLSENIEDMSGAFGNCINLIDMPQIPEKVISLVATFEGCTKLSVLNQLPSNINDLSRTFKDCIALTETPIIPNSVKNMDSTFSGCTNLSKAHDIPEGVNNMTGTFWMCTNLEGTITINANPDSYVNCFFGTTKQISLTGASKILENLAQTNSNDNITIL